MSTGVQEFIVSLLFPVFFLVIMYLIIILPHKRKEKARKQMQDSIKVGDEIMTIGGIMGKVINIKDNEITIETGVDKTKIKVFRYAIDSVTPSENK
ncbi:preprotein translocase subunit YajC [Acetivibrio clariflavus]|uniref:Preprotein translocase, YajC subunit n=1 Tax=Acetivibrio clariflavus (strain DSM 19732 / NBRC 101661 / EBR45) TaxID=720554 RepID=G8LZ35_ACECE|nr:preprotein translocase subunit YajC [Acetivibrio clariflavus]AEV68979.1 preprotein translocase, YajC subunit [Acetivibrio clariflavus DSM 19732]